MLLAVFAVTDRRVISGRHLSKHDIDRAKYMEEHELSPDELIAKAFRVIQSGRDGYQPYSKNQWITAIQKFYRRNGSVWAKDEYERDKASGELEALKKKNKPMSRRIRIELRNVLFISRTQRFRQFYLK